LPKFQKNTSNGKVKGRNFRKFPTGENVQNRRPEIPRCAKCAKNAHRNFWKFGADGKCAKITSSKMERQVGSPPPPPPPRSRDPHRRRNWRPRGPGRLRVSEISGTSCRDTPHTPPAGAARRAPLRRRGLGHPRKAEGSRRPRQRRAGDRLLSPGAPEHAPGLGVSSSLRYARLAASGR
jgi:hypothetical protein